MGLRSALPGTSSLATTSGKAWQAPWYQEKESPDETITTLYSHGQAGGAQACPMADVQEIAEIDPLEELLLAAGRGDRRAFARIYQLSASRLYPIAIRILGRQDVAEEILQEAFVSIWRKAAQFRPDRGKPLAWMATIVRHRAIDRLRAEAREPRNMAEWNESTEASAGGVLAGPEVPEHIAATIRGCLERLQEGQRRAILLAYYHGMTHEELAARLDAPLGTVKSWVRRGLLQLRECLDQ